MYVHPDLIHFIIEWVDLDYAFDVMEIMKSINQEANLHQVNNGTFFKDFIQERKSLVEELQKSKEENQRLSANNKVKDDEILEKKEEIYNKSVRSNLNDKKLTIFTIDDKTLGLSCDSTKKVPNAKDVFDFPATLNIKQEIRKRMGLKGVSTVIPIGKYDELVKIIKELIPK